MTTAILDDCGRVIKRIDDPEAAKQFLNYMKRRYRKQKFRMTDNPATVYGNISLKYYSNGNQIIYHKKPSP